MTRFLTALALLICLAAPAFATCEGRDLTDTLNAEDRAALEQRLAETPYPDGNHWIARRGTDLLHLVGTMHLSDPRMKGPVDRLRPIIERADMLLLEMTETEMALLQAGITGDPEMLLLPDTTLPELLPEEDWQRLAEALEARGMPPFMGARMQPWYVSMLLTIPPCLAAQLTEANGLDKQLEDVATAANVPTRALEPYDTGFNIFGAMPLESQIAMIQAALAPVDVNEDLFETLISAYFDEAHVRSQVVLELLTPHLTTLGDAESDAIFRLFDEELLVRRNRDWIPVILEALKETDGPVVAAFGAAHLGGEDGVLRLLEKEGFALRRAAF